MGLAIGLLAAGPALLTSPAWAGSHLVPPTFEERQHERANALRERARARAESQLGYEDAIPSARSRQIDYYALSQQISRLSAIVQRLAASMDAREQQGFIPVAPAGLAETGSLGAQPPGAGATGVRAVYGPDGPTEKSVQLILDYRLMVLGNPRLAVGAITDEGATIVARVVTPDGSLVEKFEIDKESGVWTPVR